MNYTKFLSLLRDAGDCKDINEYITECGGSLPESCYPDGDTSCAVRVLLYIWDYAKARDFRALLKSLVLSQSSFARTYGFPLRTVQNWAGGISKPTPNELNLIAFALLEVVTEDYRENCL